MASVLRRAKGREGVKGLLFVLASPAALVVWWYFPMLLIYEMVPGTWFSTAFGEPKIFSSWGYAYSVFLLLLFAIGGVIGSRVLSDIPSSQTRSDRVLTHRLPRWYIRGGLMVSLFAYMIWFGFGIYRAGGIESLWALYLQNPFYVKFVLLKTLPGITTLTQVAVVALPLVLCCYKPRRFDWFMVGVILILAAVRSFLYSERLALLELAIPLVFIIALRQRFTWSRTVRFGIAFLAMIITFFIISEAKRSFVYYGVTSLRDVAMVGFIRFWGYYLTSINNMFLIFEHFSLVAPFYNTFSFIWKFPLLKGVYEALTGFSPINMPMILASSGLNPEFNTATTLGALVVDFGLLGAVLATFSLGGISGFLYGLSRRGGIWLAFYSVWLVGLLEFMRIYFFFTTRLFPAYLFFLGAVVLLQYTKSSVGHSMGTRGDAP